MKKQNTEKNMKPGKSGVAVIAAAWLAVFIISAGLGSCEAVNNVISTGNLKYWTVEFVGNGSVSEPAPIENVLGGSTIEEPFYLMVYSSDPQHMLFKGWYKDYQCQTKWDFANDTITKNTNLYAKWVYDVNILAGTWKKSANETLAIDSEDASVVALQPAGSVSFRGTVTGLDLANNICTIEKAYTSNDMGATWTAVYGSATPYNYVFTDSKYENGLFIGETLALSAGIHAFDLVKAGDGNIISPAGVYQDWWYNNLSVEPDTDYTMRLWGRTTGGNGSLQAFVVRDQKDGNYYNSSAADTGAEFRISPPEEALWTPTTAPQDQWAFHDLHFTTPEDTTTVMLIIQSWELGFRLGKAELQKGAAYTEGGTELFPNPYFLTDLGTDSLTSPPDSTDPIMGWIGWQINQLIQEPGNNAAVLVSSAAVEGKTLEEYGPYTKQ